MTAATSFSYSNRTALVVGGTSGIGKATALALAGAGAAVVISGRRQTEGQAVVKAIEETGGRARFIQADVTDESQMANLVTETVNWTGRIDVAFNNAGLEESLGPIETKTVEEFRRVMDTNVLGVLLALKYQVPAMVKQGGGSIINNASIAGVIGMAPVPIYVASKHAVIGLTKCAALETAKQGIRINAVCPGAIETPMFDRFAGSDSPENQMRNYLASLHPIGRVGTPEEIANAVLFLGSNEASFITGTCLMVDGGFTAQ